MEEYFRSEYKKWFKHKFKYNFINRNYMAMCFGITITEELKFKRANLTDGQTQKEYKIITFFEYERALGKKLINSKIIYEKIIDINKLLK